MANTVSELPDLIFSSFATNNQFPNKLSSLLQKYKAVKFANVRTILLGMLYTMVRSPVAKRQSIQEVVISAHNPLRVLMGVVRNYSGGQTKFEMYCFTDSGILPRFTNSRHVFIDSKSYQDLKILSDL